jgi:hypothetical protein
MKSTACALQMSVAKFVDKLGLRVLPLTLLWLLAAKKHASVII